MLCSGDGNDIVTGNVGQDFIEGQGGDDFVSGDYGFDTLNGDEGNDTVLGGRGIDEVNGGEGDDLVFGGIIDGAPLNLEELAELRDGGSLEAINGGLDMRDDSVGNVLSGGDGDDDLILGSGDMADGNNGADTYHIMSEQNGDAAAMINNYVPADDAVTIIVDDIETNEEIFVDDEDGDAVIRLGDDVLARVSGAAGTISATDITLIDQGQVEAFFDQTQWLKCPLKLLIQLWQTTRL
jgi:Ca2+-binding RTX toxin-like protein